MTVHSTKPIEVVYENLIEDVDQAARDVAGLLQIPLPPGLEPIRPRMQCRSDQRTGRLVELFNRHRRHRLWPADTCASWSEMAVGPAVPEPWGDGVTPAGMPGVRSLVNPDGPAAVMSSTGPPRSPRGRLAEG